MRLTISCTLAAAVVCSMGTVVAKEAGDCKGIWSSSGESPFVDSGVPLRSISAPNGLASVEATKNGLELVGQNGRFRVDGVIGNPPVTEVLWGPDSRHFLVNESDGGVVGSWKAHLYFVESDDHPVPVDIEGVVGAVANKFPQCEPSEPANIGAVAWSRNGKELLLVAEVPPHSDCRNMGSIYGFRVSVKPVKIVERLTERQLRSKWRQFLGCRFMNKKTNTTP